MDLIDRRRIMMKRNMDMYIQDGLIFHLDGIYKGDNTNAWTDLVSGLYFPYVNGVSSLSKGVDFASVHSMFKATGSINWPFKDCTLEICVSSINNMMIFDSRPGQIALGVYAGRLLFGNLNNDSNSVSYTHGNESSTLSIQYGIGYQNGVNITAARNTFWIQGGDGITLGSRGTTSNYTGIIYDVRVYNRNLTQDEVLHNYQIDYKRFLE